MNTKHTATPWQVIPKNDHGNINYKIANESYTWIIAEMKADTDIDTQENNAKFIVKAVNMHDELVEALKAFVAYYEGSKLVIDGNFANSLAKQVLKKVGL